MDPTKERNWVQTDDNQKSAISQLRHAVTLKSTVKYSTCHMCKMTAKERNCILESHSTALFPSFRTVLQSLANLYGIPDVCTSNGRLQGTYHYVY